LASVGVEVNFVAEVAVVKVVGLVDFFGDVGAGGSVVRAGQAIGADIAPGAGTVVRGSELKLDGGAGGLGALPDEVIGGGGGGAEINSGGFQRALGGGGGDAPGGGDAIGAAVASVSGAGRTGTGEFNPAEFFAPGVAGIGAGGAVDGNAIV